jgi:IstB-like ATP binding protein
MRRLQRPTWMPPAVSCSSASPPAGYERCSLGIASHSPFNEWGHFLPGEATAVSLIDRLLNHAVIVITAGESFHMREARTWGGGVPLKEDRAPRGCGLSVGQTVDFETAIDTPDQVSRQLQPSATHT